MASIFTKIINGDIPCYKVAEDEHFIAFLDINPLQKGHTLIVPKVEVDKYFDLEDKTISAMSVFAKTVASSIKKVFPCDRVGVAVIGLEVPHAHMHLIPISTMSDMDFRNPKLKLSPEEMLRISKLIQEKIS